MSARAAIDAERIELAAIRQRLDEMASQQCLRDPLFAFQSARAQRALHRLEDWATRLNAQLEASRKREREKADLAALASRRQRLQDFAKAWAQRNSAIVASGTDDAWYGYKERGLSFGRFGSAKSFWRLHIGSGGPIAEPYHGSHADLPAELVNALRGR